MIFISGLIGLFLGAVIYDWEGALFGSVIGIFAGSLYQIQNRIAKLEELVRLLQKYPLTNAPPPHLNPTQVTPAGAAIQTPITVAEPEAIITEPAQPALSTPVAFEVPDQKSPEIKSEASGSQGPTFLVSAIDYIKRFFTTGNIVLKVGVIILFFGVAFLLKYAVDRNAFPIELRHAAVTAGAIILLIFGWRLRRKNPNYALSIQGCAVGILYLTVFSAAKLYPMLPMTFAFVVMVALVVLSCVLAVLQDSRSLAVFASAGGFLAPVLISTGTENHVALFSYYALLNAGITGIAWYKTWRVLNWLGFIFTFVIAATWGYNYYQPEYFYTTEPFLIVFFLFYLSISILFAHKQPAQLKGLVDGTLVFGTPLAGFALQSALVRDYEFGLALSAAGVAAVYVILARMLWRKQIAGMRLLLEVYLSLGIIFASMAIPFALNGRWTAAAWAVEGAGMTWVGVRQNRLLQRLFGLMLHIGSALAYLTAIDSPRGAIAVFNSANLGCLLISLSGLFSGLQSWRHRDRLRSEEQLLHVVLLIWGLSWWFGAGLNEIEIRVSPFYRMNTSLFFLSTSMFTISVLGRRLRWPAMEQPPFLLLPIMVVIALHGYFSVYDRSPFAYFGFVAWITAFITQYGLLWRNEQVWNSKLVLFWHAGTMWLLVFMVARVIAFHVNHAGGQFENWGSVVWGLIPAISVIFLIYLQDRFPWPLQRFPDSYLGGGLLVVILFAALWVLLICTNEGDPRPLPYLPVINQQEIVQIFVMLTMLEWWRHKKQKHIPTPVGLSNGLFFKFVAVLAFAWLTSVVAHSVHFYGEVPYRLADLLDSSLFQTSISIVWSLAAFLIMGLATLYGRREIWFTGTVLLAIVVGKLFITDLDGRGTVARIVSFLTVGILMLLIGYFSPLPPKQKPES